VTNRRKPTQRTTKSDWKPSRAPGEMAKAVGGAVGVVVLTALVIFVIKPGDSGAATPDPSTVTTTPTAPTSDTTVTTLPAGATTTTAATTPTSQP
jgi:hypothetical protein